jgi:hypothetical protein
LSAHRVASPQGGRGSRLPLGEWAPKCRHGGQVPSAEVAAEFRKGGLSGLEPLTSALSGGPAPCQVRDHHRGRVLKRPPPCKGRCGGRLPDWLPARRASISPQGEDRGVIMVAGQSARFAPRSIESCSKARSARGSSFPCRVKLASASRPLPAASAVSVQADRAVGLNDLGQSGRA